MKVYKLTDENGQTQGGTQWGEGVTHEAAPGDGPLCSKYWLHAYEHPLLAVLHNPIHADIKRPRLWEAEAEGDIEREGQMKLGCKRLTTLREIPLPEVTTVQRVAYAIYAAYGSGSEGWEGWRAWADKWLSGEDRSAEAAEAAEAAAAWAAVAARAAAWAVAEAAWAAVAAAWARAVNLIDCAERAMLIK